MMQVALPSVDWSTCDKVMDLIAITSVAPSSLHEIDIYIKSKLPCPQSKSARYFDAHHYEPI